MPIDRAQGPQATKTTKRLRTVRRSAVAPCLRRIKLAIYRGSLHDAEQAVRAAFDDAEQHPVTFETPLAELLCTRLANAMEDHFHALYVGDLRDLTAEDVLATRQLGRRDLEELRLVLGDLRFGPGGRQE